MGRHRLSAEQRAEREAIRRDRYDLARDMRAAKRTENKAGWSHDERNANHRHREMMTTIVSAIAEPPPTAPVSLDELRAVMADTSAGIGLRLAAAEAILPFETPQAGLAGVLSQYVSPGSAYQFLKNLAAASVPQQLKVKALRLLAGVESARAAKTDPNAIAQEIELCRQLDNAHRR
jgi:hypothetical protein